MTVSFRFSAVVVGLLFIAACDDDPIAPCERPSACQVEGLDIAIESVTPRWADDQPYLASIGMHEVRPGDTIEVDVVVVNRGTMAAEDSIRLRGRLVDAHRVLTLAATLAPLGVGERETVRFRFAIPEGPRFLTGLVGFSTPQTPNFTLLEHEDADSGNDLAEGFDFRVAAPLLEFRLTNLPDTLRTSREYPATLVVTNHSAVAYEGGLEMEWCAVYFEDARCDPNGMKTFSPFTLGSVGANETRSFPVTLEVGIESVWWFDAPSPVAVLPCVPRADYPLYTCLAEADFESPEDHSRTTIIPDLVASCNAAEIADGIEWDVTTSQCEHNVMESFPTTYAVASFESEAGACWRAQTIGEFTGQILWLREDMALVTTRDIAESCTRTAEAGTYVLIVRNPGDQGAPAGTVEFTRVH